MDTNIYYNADSRGAIATSNFEEIQKRMDLGIDPKVDYKKISFSDFDKLKINDLGFEKIANEYFQQFATIFSKHEFETVSFHDSVIELSEGTLRAKQLIIGDNSKINLSVKNFANLEEITFLSLKTFKGKILDYIPSVKKMVIWYENNKANSILSKFSNLVELWINNGNLTELVLTENSALKTLHLNRCAKLEVVKLKTNQLLETVVVEGSKKLDTSNLGTNVRVF
jgi:hypothetical protein